MHSDCPGLCDQQLKRSVHAASAFVNNNTRGAASHLREFVRQKHSEVGAEARMSTVTAHSAAAH